MASELLITATLRGAAGASQAVWLGTLLARAAQNPSRELCGTQMALGAAHWALGELDQGVRELSASISTARAVGDDLLVVSAVSVLTRMLAQTGQAPELTRAITESAVEEAAERADDDVFRAAVLMMHASAAVMSGGFDNAISAAEQALALLPDVTNDPPVRAGGQLDLALAAGVLSQSATATTTRQQAAEKSFRSIIAMETEFSAHALSSTAALMLGHLDDADYHARRAMEMANAFPFAGYVAKACQVKGMVHLSRNELDAAEETLRAMLRDPSADPVGNRAICYGLLADVAARQGNTAASAERLEKAISAAGKLGNTMLAGIYCGTRASLSLILEDGKTREWLGRAETSGAGDHPLARTTATLVSAEQKFLEDDYPAADRLAREALSLATEAGFYQQALLALRLLAFNALEADDEDTFEWAAGELEAATESSGDKMAALLFLVFQGEVGMMLSSSEEEWDTVAQLVQETLGIAEEMGSPDVVAICLQRLMTISLKRHKIGEIADPAQRLLAVSQTVDDPSGILMSIEGSIMAAIEREDLAASQEQVQWHHAYADGTPDESRSLIFEGLVSHAFDQVTRPKTRGGGHWPWRRTPTNATPRD